MKHYRAYLGFPEELSDTVEAILGALVAIRCVVELIPGAKLKEKSNVASLYKGA